VSTDTSDKGHAVRRLLDADLHRPMFPVEGV